MRFCLLALILTAIAPLWVSRRPARAQEQTPAGTISAAETERIIRAFTARESEFRRALNNYSFRRDALLQSLGMGGQVVGEYHRVSTFTFDDQGQRYEKVNFFPMSSFPNVSPEDLEDLGGINPMTIVREEPVHE